MGMRIHTGLNVFDQALMRLVEIYKRDDIVPVVSFSAGKDSGVCLELAIMAASATGRLPVKVVMRDEEILFPGSMEYAERVANRPEVEFLWLNARHPIINVYNRRQPYFWAFDPKLPPSAWVREPPPFAVETPHINIERIVTKENYPIQDGQTLYCIMGLRVSESRARAYGLYSSKGHVTKPNAHGVRNIRPIYDWGDGDVWLAHKENNWDYNRAYDVMHKMGVPRSKLRIAPPTLNSHGADTLVIAAHAWPRWFDRVCSRLEGVRSVALFGKRAVTPERRMGETWEQTFQRECIDRAPAQWMIDRAIWSKAKILSAHRHHSSTPLPDVKPCISCARTIGSWKNMTLALYNGDPFGLKVEGLPPLEPSFFRPELTGTPAGTWFGKASY